MIQLKQAQNIHKSKNRSESIMKWIILRNLLFGAVLIFLGLPWIKYPQFLFRLRNWPGVDKSMKMNGGGVKMYQVFGLLISLSGAIIIIYTLLTA